MRWVVWAIVGFFRSEASLVAENLCLRQQRLVLRRQRERPRFLVHDRDSRYGTSFELRLKALGIGSVRTPFRSPQAHAIAERWVKSVRTECLDYFLILNERHLWRLLAEYVAWFNRWRPHRSLGQQAPCGRSPPTHAANRQGNKIVTRPILGGLHHVYDLAA